MKTRVAILAALLAAACGSKKKDGGSGDQPRHSSEPGTGPLEGLFKPSSGKPTLPPPFAGAKLGSTLDELHKAVPETAKDDYLVSPDFAKVSYYVATDDAKQHFVDLRVGVPMGSRAKLTAAWGEPIVMTSFKKERALWLNPEQHLKAVLEEDKDAGTIAFQPYTPIATLLGDGKDHFGFESASMLGQPIKDLETAYKAHHDRTLGTLAFFQFGGTEYDDEFKLEVSVDKASGKADRLQFWLHHGGNEKLEADMKALLEKKFGPAKEVTENEGSPYAKKQQVFEGTTFNAVLAETEGAWVIEAAAKK
jgi:hypothetical protein